MILCPNGNRERFTRLQQSVDRSLEGAWDKRFHHKRNVAIARERYFLIACDEREWNFPADANVGYFASESSLQLRIEQRDVHLTRGSQSPRFVP
jgi:hypothetical protein